MRHQPRNATYITTPLPSPPVVGGTWQTDPGNSSNPPASVPTYLAVVVTSSTTKSGSLIAGTVVGLAIVRTDAGYGANPGHAGSGTIVAVIRQSFDRQGFMRTLGASLESIESGTVTITCGFDERMTQQHGLLHGGVLASLADVACGYAALSVMPADREV